jgi:hypothetical protein
MEGNCLSTTSNFSFLNSALAFLYSSIASSKLENFIAKQFPRGPETQIY